jgi:gas vesicle protein
MMRGGCRAWRDTGIFRRAGRRPTAWRAGATNDGTTGEHSMRHEEIDDEPYLIIEKNGSSASAFLLGLAVGAGVALLLAPQSGEATRADIARQARQARDRARDLADDVTTGVSRRIGDARDAVNTRVDRARQAVDLKRRQVERAVEAGRAAAQQAREDLERRIAQTKAAYQAGTTAARDTMRSPLVVPATGIIGGESTGGDEGGAAGTG